MSLSASLRLCVSFILVCCAPTAAEEPKFITNSLGMKFVRIPVGEFLMGSPDGDDQADADERPQHRVQIKHAFHLSESEVTQAVYENVMGDNPSWFSPQGGGRELVRGRDVGNYPVENVSWDEAVLFCERLTARARAQGAGRTFRLPTEAEWEYACRAGTTTRYTWGDEPAADRANLANSQAGAATIAQTRPVGSYERNAFGLYDMHGNVWEWCSDRYAADAYATDETVDPQGPAEGTGRVVRGGDYRSDARQARSANRDFTRQSRRDLGNGFRVVMTLENATSNSR